MRCFFCRKRHIPDRKFYRPPGSNYPYFSGARYCSSYCEREAYLLRKEIERALEADAERLKLSEISSGGPSVHNGTLETGGKGGGDVIYPRRLN